MFSYLLLLMFLLGSWKLMFCFIERLVWSCQNGNAFLFPVIFFVVLNERIHFALNIIISSCDLTNRDRSSFWHVQECVCGCLGFAFALRRSQLLLVFCCSTRQIDDGQIPPNAMWDERSEIRTALILFHVDVDVIKNVFFCFFCCSPKVLWRSVLN